MHQFCYKRTIFRNEQEYTSRWKGHAECWPALQCIIRTIMADVGLKSKYGVLADKLSRVVK